MRRFLFAIIAFSFAVSAVGVAAQPAGFEFGVEQTHKLEITPFGGYVWSASVDGSFTDQNGVLRAANFDLKSGGFYGVAVDINVKPGFQLELLWQRQDTDLVVKSGGTTESANVAVEYWQIGGLTGVQRGNLMPFTSFTLGGVRMAPDGGDDTWKFGIILGLGAKVYISEKVGLRLQGRLPWIITDVGGGLFFGSGGGSAGIVAGGMIQADLSVGLIIAL